MRGIGRKEDQEAGRRLMQALEADTLKKRQSWYADALSVFLEQGVISREQAEAIRPLIGQPVEDVMRLETPYDKAEKAGILNRDQAGKMNSYIFEKAHSGTALCSGTAAYAFAEDAEISGGTFRAEKRDESVLKVTNGASVTLRNILAEKEGDTTDHSEGSFTGLNAAVLAEGGSDGEMTPEVSYELAKRNAMTLTYKNGKTVGADRCGILTPWGQDVVKRSKSGVSEGTKVPTGGTIKDHRVHFAVDTDGRGYVNATVGFDARGGAGLISDVLVHSDFPSLPVKTILQVRIAPHDTAFLSVAAHD